jgi:hypothetical protein
MNSPDKDRATVVRWTWGKDPGEAIGDAIDCNMFTEGEARAEAFECNSDVWKITLEITVERMPNEETK